MLIRCRGTISASFSISDAAAVLSLLLKLPLATGQRPAEHLHPLSVCTGEIHQVFKSLLKFQTQPKP
ncbi:uncharacterized protein V6R79_009162 [Siganus canaliculatus]